jgi:hypothetical protein
MQELGDAAAELSNKSNSTAVAFLEYKQKFTPSACTVAPSGNELPL